MRYDGFMSIVEQAAIMPQTLLLLHLLADRKLDPAGFLLDFAGGDEEALLELAARPDLAELAELFPCLIDPADQQRLSQNALQALLDAGCKTMADEEFCRSNELVKDPLPPGICWLGGHWYFSPPPKPQSKQTGSRALALKLVQLVSTGAETRELEDVFRLDPALSFHLLRLVNSLAVGPGRRINSFSQAIIMLGRVQLRRWLNLLLFAPSKDNPCSPMLLSRAIVRARSMELLAQAAGLDRTWQDQAFMAGMFSLLGVLFGMPLESVLEPLPIGEVLNAAVLRHEGDLGVLLKATEYSEQSDAAGLSTCLAEVKLGTDDFVTASIAAHQWMLNLIRDTAGGGNA